MQTNLNDLMKIIQDSIGSKLGGDEVFPLNVVQFNVHIHNIRKHDSPKKQFQKASKSTTSRNLGCICDCHFHSLSID